MKKSILLGFFCFLIGALTVGVCLTVNFKQVENIPAAPQNKKCSEKKIITGYGYIRGCSAYTLKNKYGAYVKKVYIYSDKPVKKGDCIL